MKKTFKKFLTLFLGLAFVIAPFSAQAVEYPMGRAYDGDLTVSSTVTEDSVSSAITLQSGSGTASTTVSSSSGFGAGDYVLVIQMDGTGEGSYETRKISEIDSNRLVFYQDLENTYQSSGAQVIKINEYNDVTITASGSWQASAWDGTTGGVLVAMVHGTLTMSDSNASTTVKGKGWDGGSGGANPPGSTPSSGSGTGPGGGSGTGASGSGACGGGGAAHSGNGTSGGTHALCTGPAGSGSTNTYGDDELENGGLELGSGGGGGYGINASGGSGGKGGGIILIFAHNITISGGVFSADGNDGSNADGPGGGASGGAIRLLVFGSLALGSGVVTADGGSGGSGDASAGSGSKGRVATNSEATVTGTSDPTIDSDSPDVVRPLDSAALMMGLGSMM